MSSQTKFAEVLAVAGTASLPAYDIYDLIPKFELRRQILSGMLLPPVPLSPRSRAPKAIRRRTAATTWRRFGGPIPGPTATMFGRTRDERLGVPCSSAWREYVTCLQEAEGALLRGDLALDADPARDEEVSFTSLRLPVGLGFTIDEVGCAEVRSADFTAEVASVPM